MPGNGCCVGEALSGTRSKKTTRSLPSGTVPTLIGVVTAISAFHFGHFLGECRFGECTMNTFYQAVEGAITTVGFVSLFGLVTYALFFLLAALLCRR